MFEVFGYVVGAIIIVGFLYILKTDKDTKDDKARERVEEQNKKNRSQGLFPRY